jgi:hypothetical protein
VLSSASRLGVRVSGEDAPGAAATVDLELTALTIGLFRLARVRLETAVDVTDTSCRVRDRMMRHERDPISLTYTPL